jgi:transposase InsO family protein
VPPTTTDRDDQADPPAVGDLIDLYASTPINSFLPPTSPFNEQINTDPSDGPGPTSPAQRRGAFAQRGERAAEHTARRHAGEVGRRLFHLGWAWGRIAEWLHVASRTLRHWCLDLLDRRRPARPLGRPAERSSRDDRNAAIAVLDELGPQIGMPTLRAGFPGMRRAELDDLLRHYRAVWRERHREPLRVLTWPVPGRVWAIDFAEPPAPIQGRFGHLLAVRDLASGLPLLWRPVAAATAEEAAGSLAGVFADHGPPLVLKSDNGSHFTGAAFRDLLADHQVAHLLSPPYWPRYNGSVEAGIHALKDRTAARAARAGHPGHWTIDDLAGAQAEAAELPRPDVQGGSSPAQLWRSRTPIEALERSAFRLVVARENACGGSADGVSSTPEMARAAIRHALEECGYLVYRRRRIPPPITGRKAASNP